MSVCIVHFFHSVYRKKFYRDWTNIITNKLWQAALKRDLNCKQSIERKEWYVQYMIHELYKIGLFTHKTQEHLSVLQVNFDPLV